MKSRKKDFLISKNNQEMKVKKSLTKKMNKIGKKMMKNTPMKKKKSQNWKSVKTKT